MAKYKKSLFEMLPELIGGDKEALSTKEIAAALISCFETRLKKHSNMPKSWRITQDDIALMRRLGPYIPSESRCVLSARSDKIAFDIENDPLPKVGCVSATKHHVGHDEHGRMYDGYIMTRIFKQETSMPKNWRRTGPGTLFSIKIISAENSTIDGDSRYFSVGKDGVIYPCDGFIDFSMSKKAPWIIEDTLISAISSLILEADKRFCWVITANENSAKAHLGCMKEEVKSLLYARSLPMTSTGRKRPILHLVEAHKRRMKNGTDVDITAFLRGQQTVEFGGTLFKVQAPAVLRPTLSRPSQARYYEQDK